MIQPGLRIVATGLVVLWCGIGLMETAGKLTGPLGWYMLATLDAQGMVSLPAADSSGVTPIAEMWANPVSSGLGRVHVAAAALVAFAVLWLLGAGTLSLAGIAEWNGTHSLATHVAGGVAALAILGTALCIAGGRLSLWPFYALMLVLGWRLRARLPGLATGAWLPQGRVARAVLALALALLLLLVAAATRDRLWSDGRFMWAFKGHVLWAQASLPRWLLDPARFPTPDYPLAVPLLDWWIFAHAGQAAGALASVAGAIWLLLLAMLLWGALQRKTDEQTAAVGTLGLAAFWPLGFYATGGTADVVVAFALLGAIVELERALVDHQPGSMARAGVFLTLGAMTKNEGIALALVAAVVVGVTLVSRGERRPGRLLALAIPLLLVAPWLVFTRLHGLRSPAIGDAVAITGAAARAPVFWGAVVHVIASPAWLPATLLGICGAAGMLWRRDPGLLAVWAVLTGYAATVAAIYLQVPADIEWLISTSLPRVLGVLVPATVYLSLVTLAGNQAPVPSATLPLANA